MTTDQLTTFMCDSVAAACDKPSFVAFLQTLIDPAGPYKMTTDQLTTFMNNGVAAACDKPAFVAFLQALIDPL